MTPEPPETARRAPGRTKRLLWIAAAGLAVVLGGEGFLLLARTWPNMFARRGISRQNAERIRCGMSRSEVEAILGGPSGDYRTAGTAYLPATTPLGWDEADFPDSVWKNDSGAVWVLVDSAGRVEGYRDLPNAVFYCETRRVHINPEAFSRIKVGMSKEEVVFILGGWPNDYWVGPAVGYPDMPDLLAKRAEWNHGTEEERFKGFWRGNEGCIYVEFARPTETVASKQYWAGKRRE
jgi:hypothetical protein